MGSHLQFVANNFMFRVKSTGSEPSNLKLHSPLLIQSIRRGHYSNVLMHKKCNKIWCYSRRSRR
uniref:Putative ovule protein n=1 Tax=Solanum chacoense TaxID=4108 RepID=A0A0V0HN94_SOLCH